MIMVPNEINTIDEKCLGLTLLLRDKKENKFEFLLLCYSPYKITIEHYETRSI